MRFSVRTPNKERFLNAIHHRDSEEVPYLELEFSPRIVSAILGKDYHERSYLMPVQDYMEFVRKIGMDICYLVALWWLGRDKYFDKDGFTRYKMGTIRTREDFREMVPPEMESVRGRIEEYLNSSGGTGLGWALGLPTSASIVMAAMGFNEYFLRCYDDPNFIEEFLDRTDAIIFPLTETLLKYNPDAVILSAFVCFKSGLQMSRELTERFIFSRLKKHMNLLLTKNVPVIVHSDGDNTGVMNRWIELGFSGIHPIEPSELNNIYDYKRRWGDRITLCGNIDCATVLSQGTPEEVAMDTLEHLERLSSRGGYMCGSSHDIGDNIPIENLRAMAETVAGYKRKAKTTND